MKKTVSILCLVMALMISNLSFGQSFGIKAGLNLSNASLKSELKEKEYNLHPGFHVGIVGHMPIYSVMSVESGVLISSKGFMESVTMIDTYFTPIYLEIPLNILATFEMEGVGVYGSVGPYFGYGLAGNIITKTSIGSNTTKTSRKIKWGDSNSSDQNRIDYGISLGAGIKAEHIQVGISYNFGLANILPANNNIRLYNRVFSISFGYWF